MGYSYFVMTVLGDHCSHLNPQMWCSLNICLEALMMKKCMLQIYMLQKQMSSVALRISAKKCCMFCCSGWEI